MIMVRIMFYKLYEKLKKNIIAIKEINLKDITIENIKNEKKDTIFRIVFR